MQTLACIQPIIEFVSPDEGRELVDIAVVGPTTIFANDFGYTLEIIEVALLPVAANTVKLIVNGIDISPAWDLSARQMLSDPGFYLEPSGIISIKLGSASQVLGVVRYRKAQR